MSVFIVKLPMLPFHVNASGSNFKEQQPNLGWLTMQLIAHALNIYGNPAEDLNTHINVLFHDIIKEF